MYAAARSHTPHTEFVIREGASVDAFDNEGRTALMHAVMRADSHGACVRLLMAAEASRQVADRSGQTAFDYASAGLAYCTRDERNGLLMQLR